MKTNETIQIAIAENSVIIRNGITATLKRLPNLKIQPVEVVSIESLQECIRVHCPDILIINPTFGGYFDLVKFKEEVPVNMKFVSLVCSFMDKTLLCKYDGALSIYDNAETLYNMINQLQNIPQKEEKTEEEGEEHEMLSVREKEVMVCVVKGMTNKQIAESLFLSIHTVITHRRNIAKKLQIHSPAGLTIYAIVNKLVEISEIKKAMT